MKLFDMFTSKENENQTTEKNYTLDTKYFTKLCGTPQGWKKFRKTIWDSCGCDKKDAAWMSFFAKFVGAVVEIAITPVGIVLWVANNTKHAIMIDKKNHAEGCKSSQAWPWITLCACMAFGLIMVQDYRSGGAICELTQNVIDNTTSQLTTTDEPEEPSQIRFREFSGGSGSTEGNEKRFVTDSTTTTIVTTEVTTEATSEETSAETVYENGVPDEEGIYHIPSDEAVDEFVEEQVPAETVVVNNDGDTYQLDEDGEIIWDEESWNCYPEEEIVDRGAISFE